MDANRLHPMPHVFALIDHGYGVLAIDMHAHGESERDRYPGPWIAKRDVLVAVDYLLHRSDVDPMRISAVGLSAGASAVLQAAAMSDGISALFVDGTGMNRTSDALEPPLPEIGPSFITAPLNWSYHKQISLISGYPLGPALKEVIPKVGLQQ